MTDYLQKSTEGYVTIDEATNKFSCEVCSKLYKHRKTAEKHVMENHLGLVKITALSLEKHHHLNRAKHYEQWVETHLTEAIKELEAKVKEGVDKIAKDPIHGVSWYTEDLIKNQETLNLARDLAAAIETQRGEGCSDVELMKLLEADIEVQKDGLLNNPPRHSSTSGMRNLIDLWQHEARCQFYAGRFSMTSPKAITGMLHEKVESIIKAEQIERRMRNADVDA